MSQEFTQEEQSAKDLAIASLAVSISCILMTFGHFSFVGLIIGHKAVRKLNEVGNTNHKGFATAGIVIGYVATALAWLSIIIFFFALIVFIGYKMQKSGPRGKCRGPLFYKILSACAVLIVSCA